VDDCGEPEHEVVPGNKGEDLGKEFEAIIVEGKFAERKEIWGRWWKVTKKGEKMTRRKTGKVKTDPDSETVKRF